MRHDKETQAKLLAQDAATSVTASIRSGGNRYVPHGRQHQQNLAAERRAGRCGPAVQANHLGCVCVWAGRHQTGAPPREACIRRAKHRARGDVSAPRMPRCAAPGEPRAHGDRCEVERMRHSGAALCDLRHLYAGECPEIPRRPGQLAYMRKSLVALAEAAQRIGGVDDPLHRSVVFEESVVTVSVRLRMVLQVLHSEWRVMRVVMS